MNGPPPPAPDKWLQRGLTPVAREYYARLERGEPATTRCPSCEHTEFPPREHCRRCGAAQAWVALPDRGRLHAFTVQETALRFGPPAVLALAEVGEAIVPGVADGTYEDLRIGAPLRLETRPQVDIGLTLLFFVFDG